MSRVPPRGSPNHGARLRVYLAGDNGRAYFDPKSWRKSLLSLRASMSVTPTTSYQDSLADATHRWSLPFDHEPVHPQVNYTDLYYVLNQADVVFTWLDEEGLSPLTACEIGLAVGLGKYVMVGAATSATYREFRDLVWTTYTAPDPRSAYEEGMADVDVIIRRGFLVGPLKQPSFCPICKGKIGMHERAYQSFRKQAFHIDCYERATSPEAVSSATFTSEVLETVRLQNAFLEREKEALEVELERLRDLTSKREALRAEPEGDAPGSNAS